MATTKKKAPPKVSKEEYLEVNVDEEWLHNTPGKALYDDEYYRIIDFYVLHSPCRVSSYSPRTLESMGWKNPWLSSIFRDAFDAVPGFKEDDTYKFHASKNHFLEMWDSTGYEDFYSVEKEFAVFTYAGETNPRMDLLHHIRNAFAHGRFTAKRKNKEFYFYFEDVTEIKGIKGLYAVARICLKKTTLLEWLNLFERKSEMSKKMESLFAQANDGKG